MFLIIALQNLEPSLNPYYAPISFYARLQHGWMLLVALIVAALGTLILSQAYKSQFPDGKGARPLVRLSAAIFSAAVFRAHAYFPWEGPPTVVGTIHMFTSVCAFMLFGYSAIVISIEQRRWILWALAVTFFAASAFTCAEAGMTLLLHQKPQYMGLEERVIMFIALIWFMVLFPQKNRFMQFSD